MRAICAEAGWSRDAVDHYFAGKGALVAYAVHAAVERALPGWVERSVERTMLAAGRPPTAADRDAAAAAGRRARDEIAPRVAALLALDVDEQPTGPLALLRTAVVHPTAVLAAAGVPPVRRDGVAERMHPDDVYDLAPAAFAEVAPELHEPGLVWGAAKAHVVLARRRREGRR